MRKNILASFLLFAMALVGCTSYDEPAVKNDKEAVYLNFNASLSSPEPDASTENSTRKVAWKLKPLWGVAVAQIATVNARNTTFPAIVVIKNNPAQGTEEKVYYISTTFYRQGDRLTLGDSNPQGITNVVLDKDIYGTDIRLNRSEDWYMMAYFNGDWNQADKRMTYEPHRNKTWGDGDRNRNQLLVPLRMLNDSAGAIEGIDQPMILPWVKMTLKNRADGSLIFSPEDENTNRSIKTMGTTIALKVRGVTTSTKVLYRIGLYSNVLSNHGYYSLAKQDLPEINNDPSAILDPVWNPLNGNNGFYTSPYMLLYRANKILAPPVEHNKDLNLFPMLWGMPVPNTSSEPIITEVRAEIGRTQLTSYNQKAAYNTAIWTSTKTPRQSYSIGVRGEVGG